MFTMFTQPIFIVGNSRSGSSLTCSLFESHPDCKNYNEPLNPNDPNSVPATVVGSDFMNHMNALLHSCEMKYCVSKFLFGQMIGRQISLGDVLDVFPSAKYIVLYRQDFVASYVSWKLAKKNNRWHKYDDSECSVKDIQKITLDEEDISDYFTKVQSRYTQAVKDLSKKSDFTLLSYEELSDRPQQCFNENLFPFCGMSRQVVSSPNKKINSYSNEEIVENFDEVRHIFGSDNYRIHLEV